MSWVLPINLSIALLILCLAVRRVVEVAIEWGALCWLICWETGGLQVLARFEYWEVVNCVALGELFILWDPAGSNGSAGQRPFFRGREVWHIVL